MTPEQARQRATDLLEDMIAISEALPGIPEDVFKETVVNYLAKALLVIYDEGQAS